QTSRPALTESPHGKKLRNPLSRLRRCRSSFCLEHFLPGSQREIDNRSQSLDPSPPLTKPRLRPSAPVRRVCRQPCRYFFHDTDVPGAIAGMGCLCMSPALVGCPVKEFKVSCPYGSS